MFPAFPADVAPTGGGGCRMQRIVPAGGRLQVALAVALGPAPAVGAAATPGGDADPAFGTAGTVHVPPLATGCQDVTESVHEQPDGKLVVAGMACNKDFLVVRLQADGSLDPSFGNGGR